jgi:hypothetical protein
MIAQTYRLDLVPGRPVTPRPLISLVPGPTWMTVHRLSPTGSEAPIVAAAE